MQTRVHKIKCDFGITDYYKFYKSISKDPVIASMYKDILREYLDSIRDLISKKGYIYRFPQRMGRIEIRKTKKEVKIGKNGEIINKLPINWKKTNELWAENEIAKEKKIKIRYTNEHTNGYVFRPVYMKNTANYKNKSIYKMSINREMRRNTAGPIMSKALDAFLLSPER